MIIDATQEFKSKFKEFNKLSGASDQSSENAQKSENKQDKFKENISLQYKITLNSAKAVYFSLCKIDQILKDRKDNYFSNAAYSLTSFTNQQRNQFDQQTKIALKQCSEQIDGINISYERLSQYKTKKSNNRPKEIYAEHLKQVILCLHYFFKKIQAEFGQFLKYNERKKKKIMSTLTIEPNKPHKQPRYFQKRKQQNGNEQIDKSVNPQLQKQAHLFYLQKIQDQQKALQTKQTIQSINQMLEEMSKKVLDQQLLTNSFQSIGSVGLDFIDKGNKNLLEANTLSKEAGKYWILLFLGLAFSLLFVDFLKS